MRKKILLVFLVCPLLFSACGDEITPGSTKARVTIAVSADPLVFLWEPVLGYWWAEFNVVLSERGGVQATVETVELEFLDGTTSVAIVIYDGGTLPANGTLEIACTPEVEDYSDKMQITVTGEDANGSAVDVSRIPNTLTCTQTPTF